MLEIKTCGVLRLAAKYALRIKMATSDNPSHNAFGQDAAMPNPNPEDRDIYSVVRLNAEARALLEGAFPLVWVQGEQSNVSRPSRC